MYVLVVSMFIGYVCMYSCFYVCVIKEQEHIVSIFCTSFIECMYVCMYVCELVCKRIASARLYGSTT